MGQTTTKESPPFVIGFDGPQRSPLDKRKSLKNAAVIAKDAFFENGEATNVINPIYLADDVKKDATQVDLAGAFNIGQFLDMLTGKGKDTKGLGTDADGAASSSEEREKTESSSSEVGEIGKYVRERKSYKAEEDPAAVILKGSSHPISVKGQVMLGEGLIVEDLSDYSLQYPLTDVQWFLSSLVGDNSVFDDRPINQGTEFILPPITLARYIQIIATRQVQDLTGGVAHRAAGRDIYDPHLRDTTKLDPVVMRAVRSVTIIGPVVMTSSWAAVYTALLSGADRSLLQSHTRKLCITKANVLRKIVGAIVDEDEERANALIERDVSIMKAKFKDSHTFVGYVSNDFFERFVHDNTNDYAWLSQFQDHQKLRFKYKDFYLGVSFVGDDNFVPFLHLTPRRPNAAASTKSRPLILCPEALMNDVYETPVSEGDLTFIFCLVNCFQAAEEASTLETRKRRFPSCRKEWQVELERGDHSTVQDLLQFWLQKNKGRVHLGAQFVYS